MRRFRFREIDEATAYAAEGGQALHLHRVIVDYEKAPRVFVDAVKRGEFIAHLFDQDRDRLEQTARELGVNAILVEREGRPSQHIDLCGGPLKRAVAMCEDI